MVKFETSDSNQIRFRGVRSPGIVECGYYSPGVRKYLNTFGATNVKILIFEEWIKQPIDTVNSILEFLNVDCSINKDVRIANENASRIIKNKFIMSMNSSLNTYAVGRVYLKLPKPLQGFLKNLYYHQLNSLSTANHLEMSEEQKVALTRIYARDVALLKELLKIDLPWSNFQCGTHVAC
jgi:hypothetical protein